MSDYDLLAACEHNDINASRISSVLLEITGPDALDHGEYNGADWHWLVTLTDGGYAYVHGGCDFTGWDCQSYAEMHEAHTLEDALALVPQDERRIFEEMRAKGVRSVPAGRR